MSNINNISKVLENSLKSFEFSQNQLDQIKFKFEKDLYKYEKSIRQVIQNNNNNN